MAEEEKLDKQDKKKESKEQLLEQTKNRLLREKANSLFNSAFEAREHYDWEWLTRDLFRRGYQFSTYDNRSKTVLLATRRGVKFPVNLLWAQMKAIRNQVTNFQPKWEVLPVSNSEDAITNARYSGRLLDYYYRRLGLRKTIKETVMQGLLFSVGGPWQIGYDADADGGRGEVYCWLLDTYDFYIDPNATSLPEAEYCVKAMRKNLAEITSNPKYQFYGPIPEKGESRVAASYSKQFLLQTLRAKVGTAVEEEEEGAILKEVWIKTRVSEENKEELTKELAKNEQETKDLRTGEVLMRIVHYVDFLDDPLLVQLKRTNEFPFVLYSADISPCEIYGESWAKHIIPVNRVLNALESSVFTYNYRYAIGRIVVDKNSGVRLISNQHGDFIEKNRGSEVTSMPLQSLPSSYQYQIDNCRKYIEDLGGAHEPSRGIVPTGVTSGIAIAELKQADACVDIKTEALTKRGWKKYDELLEGEDIYTLNPSTKKGEWGKLNNIFYYDKQEIDVYQLESRNISCIVTHDHSWFVYNTHRKWETKKTEELVNNDYLPLSFESSSIPKKLVYSNGFVELAGWVITEGEYGVSPTMEKRGSKEIRISQMAFHKKQCKKIKDLFKRMEIDRKPYLDKNGCYHFAFTKENAIKIREIFPNKTLTMDFVTKLTKPQLELLLDTMILGDGSIRHKGRDNRRCFINTKKETIDSLQVICSLLGINTSISSYDDGDDNHALQYVLYLKGTDRVHIGSMKLKDTFKKIKFTGRVWCPNTDTGYWLARRDGKVFYTGNSNSSDLVDNLEDFLVEVGKKILKVIAENYDIPKIIKDLGLGGDVKHFAIIGEKSAKSRKNTKEVRIGVDTFKLAVIGSDNEIRVTVGSWLAYTKDARQERIKELFNSGLIDQKTALQHMEFSDIDTIVESVRKEEILKKFRGSTAQGAKEEVSDEEIARQENLMMTKEKREIEPLVTDNHTIHNIVHQEALGISGNELVEKHMSLHNALIEKYGPGGQQETPEEVVAGREQLAGVPAEGAVAPTNAPLSPQGLPAGPQAPQSPEETALAQSLAEAGMGRMK